MSTFLAGLRSRRWLNMGVFSLGTLAMLVAVATPLYARSSAEHLLDQRTAQRLTTETGLNVESASGVADSNGIFAPVANGPDAAPDKADDSTTTTGSPCSTWSRSWRPPRRPTPTGSLRRPI